MHITVIPHAAVAADYLHVKSLQDTSHPASRSQRFNTARHTRLNMLPVVPETPTFTHEEPPWTAYGYVLWHPLIARSQKLISSHIVQIPSFLYDDLMRCHAAWVRTNWLPPALVDEVVETWQSTPRGRTLIALLDGEKEWFFRLDQMSPKDSPFGGTAPSTSLTHMVTKLCSSMRAMTALQSEQQRAHTQHRELEIHLVLNPWDAHMRTTHEFRVFVPPPAASRTPPTMVALRIAAISQYAWHAPFAHPHGFSVAKTARAVYAGAQTVLQDVRSFMRDALSSHVTALLLRHGFSFDVVLGADARVQLVEVNPFGARSGCGACLFHWVRDGRVLYGLESGVEVRISAGGMCLKYCCWGCEVPSPLS